MKSYCLKDLGSALKIVSILKQSGKFIKNHECKLIIIIIIRNPFNVFFWLIQNECKLFK